MYWDERSAYPSNIKGKFVSLIYRKNIYDIFFKVRLGADVKIMRYSADLIQKKGEINILDIGCGWGVSVASTLKKASFFGVDILGAPFQRAISAGYRDAKPYDNDYKIPYEEKFDLVIMKDVNAHVDDATLALLLGNAVNSLKEGGKILLFAELDNDGFSYSMMKKISRKKFDVCVKEMDHINFKNERELDQFLKKINLKVNKKDYIITEMVNLVHWWHYFFGGYSFGTKKAPFRVLKIFSLGFDVVASVLNSLLGLIINPEGRSFSVCYELSPADDSHKERRKGADIPVPTKF